MNKLSDFIHEYVKSRPGVGEALSRQRAGAFLNDTLIAIRKTLGWSQRELANRAGWQQPHVARLESATDYHDYTLGSLQRYAAACNLKIAIAFYSETSEGVQLATVAPIDGSEIAAEAFSQLVDQEFEVPREHASVEVGVRAALERGAA